MTRVVLHIHRLVLRGVDRNDAATVSAALEARLHDLLSADGGAALREQAGTPRLRVAQVPLPAGADAAALGHAVAGRVAGTPAKANATTRGGTR